MERFHVHQIFHEFCKECPYAEVITEGPKKVFADGGVPPVRKKAVLIEH